MILVSRNFFPEISISKLVAKLNLRLMSEKNQLKISKLLAFLQQKKVFLKLFYVFWGGAVPGESQRASSKLSSKKGAIQVLDEEP